MIYITFNENMLNNKNNFINGDSDGNNFLVNNPINSYDWKYDEESYEQW